MTAPEPEPGALDLDMSLTDHGMVEHWGRIGTADMLFVVFRVTPADGHPYIRVQLGCTDDGGSGNSNVIRLDLPLDTDTDGDSRAEFTAELLQDMADILSGAVTALGYNDDDEDGGDPR